MQDIDAPVTIPPTFTCNVNAEEARLEAQEYSKYILAKSYFDCREYDRCAAVFLPSNLPRAPLSHNFPNVTSRAPTETGKGKAKESGTRSSGAATSPSNTLPHLSQKALFLSLYAKYMSGEKRKDEESEMILGPADGGSTVNKELVGLARSLEGWFADRSAKGLDGSNQGWLEYLYGIVLAKSRTEDDARKWLVTSVRNFPFNWGAWLELSDLLNNIEEVSRVPRIQRFVANESSGKLQKLVPELQQNLMTLIFHLYASQELYQSTEQVHHTLTELETVFPESQFLKTQRALLFYHSKGTTYSHSVTT